jgi:hypothetical protein
MPLPEITNSARVSGQVETVKDELFETNFELQGCNKRLKLATDQNEELDAKLNEALQAGQVLIVCWSEQS